MKAKWPLDIFLVVPGMPFDGNTIKLQSLGGSESAGYYMARELQKRGHKIVVFSNLPRGQQNTEIDGITYLDISNAVQACERAPHDILIVQRLPKVFGCLPAAKQRYLWNHDLALKRAYSEMQGTLWNVDGIFLLSEFHVKQTKEVFPFLANAGDFCIQTRNGIDLDAFPKGKQKVPKKLLYSARPERGLANLVGPGGIMEILHHADPEVHLYVAGYDNTVPEMRPLYEELWRRCKELPNVTNLGSLTKDQLYRHMVEAEAYVYPTEFEEISCITAMECMACGTPFVTSPIAALPETLDDKTAIWVKGKAMTAKYHQEFTMAVLDLLEDQDKRRQMSHDCRNRAMRFSWAGVAEQWEEIWYQKFIAATEDKKKLVSHFLYHDDVVVAREVAREAGLVDEMNEIHKTRSWAWSQESHNAYYDEFSKDEMENYQVERHGFHYDNVFKKEGRWTAIQQWLSENNIPQEAKILDVGCGCGYFSVGMANLGYHVTGIDVSPVYIERATELAKQRLRHYKGKADFYMSDSEVVFLDNYFDVIVISEVIEHLGYIEPVDFVRQFEPSLKPDGRFVITTPFGPLRRAFPKNSGAHDELHVRHLERWDIRELFGNKEAYEDEILYWQNTQHTKELLGWYIYSFGKAGEYGEIDLERKVTIQMPRDRLSVCMIMKNEQANLQNCLDSVYEVADEIVIADTGSTDKSVEVAKAYGAKIIKGDNPLEHGFEVPRNQSLEPATGDWVLWLDADETLQGADNLYKYLRNSPYMGFRLRQHHFACHPPEAYKVDKPTRIFRNKRGVKFFGMIHEHPELAINEGVGDVIELSDVDIAHNGYYTEQQRRKKFWRNLPLQLKDREKYPDRMLGKFLYMRDLVQLVQWSIEQTGRITPDAFLKCQEVVQMYRMNFLPMGGYMMLDGLQYYSTALKLLGRGHEYSWATEVSNNGTPKLKSSMSGRFANNDDFQLFFKRMTDDKTFLLEGKYI